MSPRRHHIVSAGYQRYFADGELIRHWVKADRTWTPPIGVRDSFVEKGFNSIRSPDPAGLEHMENEWSQIERVTLPAIAALESGERSMDVATAVKAIAAIHFCRSYSFRELSNVFIERERGKAAVMETQPNMIDAFAKDHGRQPRAGEIEALYQTTIDRYQQSNFHFVNSMGRIYGKVMELLDPLHLQVVVPRTRAIGLLTSDSPVVIKSKMKIGPLQGVGIERSDLLYLPLSRWMAVCFVVSPLEDHKLAPSEVQMVNLLMLRNCMERMAAHPDEDIPRALGLRAPDGWPPPDQSTPGPPDQRRSDRANPIGLATLPYWSAKSPHEDG